MHSSICIVNVSDAENGISKPSSNPRLACWGLICINTRRYDSICYVSTIQQVRLRSLALGGRQSKRIQICREGTGNHSTTFHSTSENTTFVGIRVYRCSEDTKISYYVWFMSSLSKIVKLFNSLFCSVFLR